MPDFNELLKNEQIQNMMHDRSTIDRVKQAPESQRILELLTQQANCSPETMIQAATQGHPQQLMDAIQKLLHDPESQKLLDEISHGLKL